MISLTLSGLMNLYVDPGLCNMSVLEQNTEEIYHAEDSNSGR